MDDISLVSNQRDEFKDIVNESRISNSIHLKLSNIKFELYNDLVVHKGNVHIIRNNKQENVMMYLLKSLTIALVNINKFVSNENCITNSYVISPTCYIINCDENITYFVTPNDILYFKVDDHLNYKKWNDLINESIQKSSFQLYEAIDNTFTEQIIQYEDCRVVNIPVSNIDVLISNIDKVNEWAIIKSSELKGLITGSQIYEVNNTNTNRKTFQETIEIIKQSKHIIKLTLRRAISRQGYILHHDNKSIRFHFWKTKFLVLRYGYLKVYDNHRQINHLESIQLRGSILVLLPYNIFDKFFCFRVNSFDGNTLSFRCSDEIQFKDWTISVSHAIAIANGGCYLLRFPLISMNQIESYDPNKTDSIIESCDDAVNNNDIIHNDNTEYGDINANTNISDSMSNSDLFTPMTISTDEIKQMSIRTQIDFDISTENIEDDIPVITVDELSVKESIDAINHEISLNVFNNNKDDQINDVSICTVFNDIFNNTNTLTSDNDYIKLKNNYNSPNKLIDSDKIVPIHVFNVNPNDDFTPQSLSIVSCNQSKKYEIECESVNKNEILLCADDISDLLDLAEGLKVDSYKVINEDLHEAVVNEYKNLNPPQTNTTINDIANSINLENNQIVLATDSNFMSENRSNQIGTTNDVLYGYHMNSEHLEMLKEDKISPIQNDFLIDIVSDVNVNKINDNFPNSYSSLTFDNNQTFDTIVETEISGSNVDIIISDLVNDELGTDDDEKKQQDNESIASFEFYTNGEIEDSSLDLNDSFIENNYRDGNIVDTLPIVSDDEPIDSSKLIFTSDSDSR